MAGKRKRRINSGETPFPMNEMIPVEAIMFKGDGSIDVVIADENLPDQLRQPIDSISNPRRKAKAKRRK